MTALPQNRLVVVPSSIWPRGAATMVGVVACATLLDAWDRPIPGAGMLWLDFAAILALGWSLLSPGAERRPGAWLTPFDGRIVAGLVLAGLDVVHSRGSAPQVAWMHQLLSATLCYYAFAGRFRHQSRGPELLWLPFGIVASVLGLVAVVSMTSGITALAITATSADAAWAADYGVTKALVFATLACAGRACERESSPLWRLATLLGASGCTLYGLVGGVQLETRALVRLDEPMYFSTMAVTLLLLIPLARAAWLLRRERPQESSRWAGLAFAFGALAFMSVLGESTGGEGVRVLAVLGAAAVVVGREAPRRSAGPTLPPLMEQAAPPVARAA